MSRFEKQPKVRNPFLNKVLASSLLVLSGCGLADCNPADSVTIDADQSSSVVKEIEQNFPGASDIKVTHAADNPNILKWEMPDGQYCTATGSQTFSNADTPGELIATPYCRQPAK